VLSEYFSLDEVILGLLKTFETLFGLVFEEITEEGKRLLVGKHGESEEAAAWHESVTMFPAWNEEAMGVISLSQSPLVLWKERRYQQYHLRRSKSP